MESVEYVKPDFPRNAFAGTAADYVRFRLPYPGAMLRDLLDRSGARSGARLLDLACGPGRVTLPLAPHFREVSAVDLEPEMLATGKQEAARQGLHHIAWLHGRAEEVRFPPAWFDLITIGEAFHRLDQEVVARQAFEWLRPGGCLALLGSHGVFSGEEPWQKAIADVVRRRTDRNAAAASRPVPGSSPEHFIRVLWNAGFVEVANHTFVEPHQWTVETILGNLYSTSVCSRRLLGDETAAFAAEVAAALHPYSPDGRYTENVRFGYTLGKRPA